MEREAWLSDSDAGSHMGVLEEFKEKSEPKPVKVGDEHPVCVQGMGRDKLCSIDDDWVSDTIVLHNVLLIPDLETNLFLVRKVDDLGYSTTFAGCKCIIRSPQREVVLTGAVFGLLYALTTEEENQEEQMLVQHYAFLAG